MKKWKSHGEFVLISEFSDKQFANYFRLNRNHFNEVLDIVNDKIYSGGCNAQGCITHCVDERLQLIFLPS